MTERCKYDREREAYLRDGEPCRTDGYGDPTYHCRARRSCGNHIAKAELTCARCIGRTRVDIRRTAMLAPLMLTQALGSGVNSEAANLAGPATDVEAWSWHKIGAKRGLYWHVSLIEDDEDFHPYTVLTRWEFMLREDYSQPRSDATSISSAAAYLERTLPRLAQDPEQDFPLFRNEIRACREHMEVVISNSATSERGAPCPDCKGDGQVVRMTREYGHWCTDPLCEKQYHHSVVVDRETGALLPDTSGDRWVCPRNRDHWRSHADYERWIEERTVGA